MPFGLYTPCSKKTAIAMFVVKRLIAVWKHFNVTMDRLHLGKILTMAIVFHRKSPSSPWSFGVFQDLLSLQMYISMHFHTFP